MTEKAKFLDKQVFESPKSASIFNKELISLDDHITPEFMNREEWYKEKWGKFLEKTWESDKIGPFYKLYLPKDLKISELPAIIYRVNKLAYGGNLPERASTKELRGKIIFAVDILLSKLSESTTDEKEIKKAIKKYVKLYAQLFWETESHELNNKQFRKQVIEQLNITMKKEYSWTKEYSKYLDYQKQILQISSKEKIEGLSEEIEKNIAKEIKNHFREAFFELWIENLTGKNSIRLWLQTFLQSDLEEVEKTKNRIDKKEEEWDITIRVKKENLDKEERRLRDKIWIDKYKKELEEIRGSWDWQVLAKKELYIVNQILTVLYEYPYQYTERNFWYQPSKIERSKEVYCLWFSLIWHGFLSELGIKHNWLMASSHSSLEVIIWWKKYYFDPTFFSKEKDFNGKMYDLSYKEKGEWLYNKKVILHRDVINADSSISKKEKVPIKLSVYSWDVEMILLYSIYNNRGIYLEKEDTEESLDAFIKASEIFPNSMVFRKIWNTYLRMKENKKSLDFFGKAIVFGSNYYKDYLFVIEQNLELWKNIDAIKYIKIAQKKFPNKTSLYNKKSEILLTMINEWNNKELIRIQILNEYCFYLLNWLIPLGWDKEKYKQEKQKIKEFIGKNNYTWLRDYMLSLEEWLFEKQ